MQNASKCRRLSAGETNASGSDAFSLVHFFNKGRHFRRQNKCLNLKAWQKRRRMKGIHTHPMPKNLFGKK